MTETSNSIQKIKSVIAQCKHEIKQLNTRGKNSVQFIRSTLDLLNLDFDSETVAALDIDAAYVEILELIESKSKILQLQEKQQQAEKQLKEIERSLKF